MNVYLPEEQPEPCLKNRCRSVTACSGFGYCRERNMGVKPMKWKQKEWRELADQRKRKHSEEQAL